MLKTELAAQLRKSVTEKASCRVVVIWIDWYAYHLARFRGLLENDMLANQVAGIEMVGGIGVHAGLKFRETIPASLPVQTLFPGSSWQQARGLKVAVALWKCLNRLNPEVVLVPGYYTLAGLACALWGKLHHRRTVLMTESTQHDHSRVWWKEAIKGLLVRSLFDWAVAGGKAHQRYLHNLKFPKDRVARYYDVVDNDFFHERARALRNQCKPDDFSLPAEYFLYVGRLSPEKNIAGLLRAYLEYRRAGGRWSLVLVGDGPETGGLRESAAASGFGSDIYFEGLKSTSELPQYYAFAGCFVLPSTREPWGLVANEAMASNLPLIVSQCCGCVEDLLHEGKNGFSFDPAKSDELSACLTTVSSMKAETRAAFGQASYEIVSDFSPRHWASEIARIANS